MFYHFSCRYGSSTIRACLGILGLLVVTSQGVAEENILKGEADSWVEYINIPEADPKRKIEIQGGISNILADTQVVHRPSGQSEFIRIAYQIVERPGLESGAAIDIEFDPSRHKVTLNRLQIRRDGVVIDRLPDVQIDIYRQEKDAQRGVFDGKLTARINLQDVHVGDIIDYATTYEIAPLLGKPRLSTAFFPEWTTPVALIRRKIAWPTSNPLSIKATQSDVKPVIETDGPDTIYTWSIVNPASVKIEEYLPPGNLGRGLVEVSSWSSWQEVADALLPHYQPSIDLPATFAEKLDAIAARYPDPKDRMIHATRMIQDDIRYVSLSIGAGSYLPRSPDTVISSGFGDCKDKALLLASALSRLGISAQVALTDADEGQALGIRLPSPNAFDHAIVKAQIGDQTYWLDATDYLQGGNADTLVQPAFGFALPLVGSGARMEPMPPPALDLPTTRVSEIFDFYENPGEPIKFQVTTVYEAADADSMRRTIATQSTTSLADNYLKYYERPYPGITSTSPLDISDDRDKNVLTTKETYELPSEAYMAGDLAKNFPLKAELAGNVLPTPAILGRKAPIYIGTPFHKRHTVKVRNLKARFDASQMKDVVTPYLSFDTSWSATQSELELDWKYRILNAQVQPSDAAAYLQSLNDISGNSEWAYDLAYTEPTPSEVISAEDFFVLIALAMFAMLMSVAVIREIWWFKPRVGQAYWPISLSKFLLMSASTMGFYASLWAWRAFRQQQGLSGYRVWPFVKSFFLAFSLAPAFVKINGELGDRKLPVWAGIAGATVLVASLIYSIVGLLHEMQETPFLDMAQLLCWIFAPIGLVIAANRMNEQQPVYLAANSRLSAWDVTGVVVGGMATFALLYLVLKDVEALKSVPDAAVYSAAP